VCGRVNGAETTHDAACSAAAPPLPSIPPKTLSGHTRTHARAHTHTHTHTHTSTRNARAPALACVSSTRLFFQAPWPSAAVSADSTPISPKLGREASSLRSGGGGWWWLVVCDGVWWRVVVCGGVRHRSVCVGGWQGCGRGVCVCVCEQRCGGVCACVHVCVCEAGGRVVLAAAQAPPSGTPHSPRSHSSSLRPTCPRTPGGWACASCRRP
jgi:hypothetical protein